MEEFVIKRECNNWQHPEQEEHECCGKCGEAEYTVVNCSLTMYGVRNCSGGCYYCSARHTMGYDEQTNNETFIFNGPKIIERLREYIKTTNNIEDLSTVDLLIDVWGGNPLDNFDCFKRTIDFIENDLRKLFHRVEIHTSGNGLEMRKKEVVDYLIEHRIGYQLSHDGCGQFLRTGEIDPLYWEKTKDNLVLLAKENLFDWICCALSAYNFSPISNLRYFTNWIEENNLEDHNFYIKLHHIYPGTKPINKHYVGPDKDYIKNGDLIGELQVRGDRLRIQMNEYEWLTAISCYAQDNDLSLETQELKSTDLKYFMEYFRQFVGFFRPDLKEYDNSIYGACSLFQKGINKVTFVIDTAGEFSPCNVMQHDVTMAWPTCEQAPYCKDCEFRFQSECNSCGIEAPEEMNPETGRCYYRYNLMRLAKRITYIMEGRKLSKKDFDDEEIYKKYKEMIKKEKYNLKDYLNIITDPIISEWVTVSGKAKYMC